MTPEIDMLEAVARAIYEKENPHGKWENILSWMGQSDDEYAEEEVARYRGLASAALTVALDRMMEPSEGMLAACNGADRLSTAAMVDANNHATWQAMLDQLAKEAFDD